jgi:hypothetical protein
MVVGIVTPRSQARTLPNHAEDVSGDVIAAVGDLVPHPARASAVNAAP